MNYQPLIRLTTLSCLLLGAAFASSSISSTANPRGATPARNPAAISASKVNPVATAALTNLQKSNRSEITTQLSPQTGSYRFVRAANGVLAASDSSATPQTRAKAFLATHGGLVGMSDDERASAIAGSDLQATQPTTDALEMTHVRLNQSYRGIPVFGAQVIVHMNEQGITGVNGDYVPRISVGTIPLITEGSALEAAMTALQRKTTGEKWKVARVETVVYPAGLLEGRPVTSRLAYSIVATAEKSAEQVLIDGTTGAVLLQFPVHQTALFRTIYSPRYDPMNPDLFVQRREGDPPSPAPFVNNLYDFAGQTYNLYSSAFGRDSYDGLGHHMVSVYLINEQCPNAYWNGTSTNYCPIFDADDVVSHEWSHAYTEYTHGLVYAFQSGALNESYSDIFGETVDLINGVDGSGGNNNAQPYPNGQRWLVGEDLGQQVQELLLRDMYDPDRLGDPGKVSSPNYACGTDDGGGVHTNSGVPNHAYALIVDGTQFLPGNVYNGQTITGIGLTKAAAIYFRAESVYQTPTTDFPAHAIALQTSCGDLVGANLNNLSTDSGTGTPSSEHITAADCQEVTKAMLAVEMSLPPVCATGPLLNPDEPPLCQAPTVIFSEDWETGEDGWTKTSMGYLTGLIDWEDASKMATRFFHVVSNLPGGRTGSAAFAINPLVGQPGGGTCAPGGDYSGSHTLDSPPITIPAGATAPMLVFDHYVATETGVDGGQVEISVNGLPYQLLPRSEYVFNPPNSVYNEAAPVGNNTGPNPGEDAWTGTNLGGTAHGSWGTTVANLGSVAQPGDTINIRFTWSQDGCNGVEGWYIDNIRVIQCPVLEAPVLSTGSDYQNPDPDGSYTLTWVRPNGATGPDLVQVTQEACAPLLFENAENGLANWTATTSGAGAINWTTGTKPQHTSTTFYAQGTEGTVSADSYLTYNNPITIPTGGQTFLNFLDWDNNEGDDNVLVEVSVDNGTTWESLYIHNRSELGTGPISFATEPLFQRSVNLANYGGQTIRLRFHYSLGPENRAGSTPFGWYVDDISIVNDAWFDVSSTSSSSLLVQNQTNGTRCYRVRTTYTINGQMVVGPFSNVVTTVVDLQGGGPTPTPGPTATPGGPTPTPGPTLTPGPTATPHAQTVNLSTRLFVQTSDRVGIGGFIINGTAPKQVIVRGIGPSLNQNGLTDVLADPVIELHGPNGFTTVTNNNWKDTQETEIRATGLAPTDDRESAILATLNPGAYTAIVKGNGNTSGVGLVEIYDLNEGVDSRLANLSTRGFVNTGDNIIIGGFTIRAGSLDLDQIVLRGIGPSLAPGSFPASAVLPDPRLELRNSNGTLLVANNNWQDDSVQAAQLMAAGLAPSNNLESGIATTLSPGAYTALLFGVGNGTGIGLVEVYDRGLQP
jgi:bacillolysin